MQKVKTKAGLLFPTNVHILHKSLSGQLLNERTIKNMVLKEYGLYSYIRFILGSFKNGNLSSDADQYIPKYLALGSNQPPLTGAVGTTTAVNVTDTSLYHEINDTAITGETKNRINLNRANYVEDNQGEPYLKVQFEAYVPEDRFVNETIGEAALMTGETGWNAFARVSGFEPFVKVPNTVIQIIWEITIISVESYVKYAPPTKIYLKECIEKAIDVLEKFTSDASEENVTLTGSRLALENLIIPSSNVSTGMYLLLNENENITQDKINNFLSKPFVSVNDTGLVALIQKFDPNWEPINKN